jgi:crotonobetainyl-CoA:carnitine CoA-transferase CaiB-like acyl-CoA transferase
MENINVLEIGTYWSAALVTTYLSKFGCRVTTVTRPATIRGAVEERRRLGPAYERLQQNKTVVALDWLKDRASLVKYIKEARVVVINFEPSVLKRWKLDYDTCVHINPDIIYVYLPGFATTDDTFANVKAYESVILASAGSFVNMGLNRTLLGVGASYTHLPLASVYGSVYATFATVVALTCDRRGEYIEIPLASALSEAMIHNSIKFPKDDCYMNMRERQIRDGQYPIDKKHLDELQDPFFSTYVCKGDRPYYLVCPAHARHQRNALGVLGIEHELSTVDTFADREPRFGIGCANMSREEADHMRPIMAARFLTKTAFEWETLMGNAGVPGAAHRTCDEWKNSSHVRDSGLVDDHGTMCNIGWMEDPRPVPPEPTPGDSHWLEGYTVIDLTNVIAGPTIGTMFSRYGATVIKVDSPTPTYAPEISVVYGLATNVGKRSILLDIFTPRGRQILESLLRRADLLLVNCTSECLARMRLTRDDLALINPTVILMQFDAWSGPRTGRGHMVAYNGYDDCVQAASGIMYRFGGDTMQTVEEHAHIGTIDVCAGVAGAATACVALYLRRVSGTVCTARTSLASVGQYLQIPFMYGAARMHYGLGTQCRGEHNLLMCYQAREGWFLLVGCLDGTGSRHEYTMLQMERLLHGALTDNSFKKMTVCEAIRLINAGGHTAYPLKDMNRVKDAHKTFDADIAGLSYQFLYHTDHPIGSLEMVAPVAIRSRGIIINSSHAPKYGRDTREILYELGFRPEFDRMQWSKTYMPFSARCDYCESNGKQLIILSCDHKLCRSCILGRYCRVCGQDHEFDDAIRAKFSMLRVGYTNWRRGSSKGCRDIENVTRPAVSIRRTKSEPHMDRFLDTTVGSELLAHMRP